MAIKKEKTSKPKKSAAKKTNSKPLINLGSIQKKLKLRYEKSKLLYSTALIAILIFVVLASLFWFNKNLFLAGTINGKVVTSLEFYSKLAKAHGDETFDSIVREALIKQEAKNKGVTIAESDVDKKIEELEKQFGGKEGLDQALTQNNTNLEDLKQQINIQLIVEKLLEDKLKVSEKEVDQYIKENKKFNPKISKEEAREAVKSSKLNEAFTAWFEELKSKASISTYF